jgi:uncharacterized protein YggT (Ycf19 family)
MTQLIISLLNFYLTLFLARFLIPNTGQMYFNGPYQWLIKITNPVCNLFRSLRSIGSHDLSALVSFFVLLAVKTVLLMNRNNILLVTGPGLFYSMEPRGIYYISKNISAVLHFSFTEYLCFLFRVYIFILIALQIANTQRLYNSILMFFEQFLNALLNLLYFKKTDHNLYYKPVRSFIYIFFLFTVLNALLFFSGEQLGILSFSLKPFFFCFLKSIIISVYFLLDIVRLILPLMFIRVILSWFSPRETVLFQLLTAVTDPVFRPFDRLNLRIQSMDFSPIVAFLFVYVVLDVLMMVLNNLYSLF